MASDRIQRRIERLLDTLEEAADQRDWARVRLLAEDVLVVDPTNVDAQTYIAAAERASITNEQDATSDSFIDVEKISPGRNPADYHHNLPAFFPFRRLREP